RPRLPLGQLRRRNRDLMSPLHQSSRNPAADLLRPASTREIKLQRVHNLHPRNPRNPWLIHRPRARYLATAAGRSLQRPPNALANCRYCPAERYSSHIELLQAASCRFNIPASSGVFPTREKINSIPFQCESMERVRLKLSPDTL